MVHSIGDLGMKRGPNILGYLTERNPRSHGNPAVHRFMDDLEWGYMIIAHG